MTCLCLLIKLLCFLPNQLREMVKAEVQNAKKQSLSELDGLLETIQLLANDTQYECAMGKMEVSRLCWLCFLLRQGVILTLSKITIH